MSRRSARDFRLAPIDAGGYVTFPAKPKRKRRIPLSPGYHAEPGETMGHQHDVYTTLGELHGYERIHVGTLMKRAVEAWAKSVKPLPASCPEESR